MTIFLRQPSFVYHNHNVDRLYSMRTKVVGTPATTLNELVGRIFTASLEAGWLQNVIINTHGYAGGFDVGNEHYNKGHLHLCVMLSGRISTIWLTSCETAKDSIGQDFCSTLSKITRANVVASADYCIVKWYEVADLVLYPFTIDDYGGDVFVFRPDGSVKRVRDPAEELKGDTFQPPRFRMPPR